MSEDINQAIERLRKEISQMREELKGFNPKPKEYWDWVKAYHCNIMLQWEMEVKSREGKYFSFEEREALRKLPTRAVK